jgi:hypothetical protein
MQDLKERILNSITMPERESALSDFDNTNTLAHDRWNSRLAENAQNPELRAKI